MILIHAFIVTVFFVSGVAKLVSRYSFYDTLMKIGLKDPLSNVISWLFPLVEILAAALLLIEPAKLYGEIMILCMLLLFVFISVRALGSKEKQIDCQCFGNLVEESLGVSTLIRSIVLILCVVPLFFQKNDIGLFRLSGLEMAYVFTCAVGILALYALLTAYWKRQRLNKGGDFL